MKSFFRSSSFALILILTAALIVGYFTAPDYGLSWDEPGIYRFANNTLKAYPFIFHPQDFQIDNSIPILNLYGPAHFMYSALAAKIIVALQPAWTTDAATHFVYFITFLFGFFFFYLLAKRWMSDWAAFGVALLFLTQPLFWGHALMNPKDTPFMAFFIASVYFGLRMFDDSEILKHKGHEGKSQDEKPSPLFVYFVSFVFKVLVAGIVLGLATSIRVLAPMAAFFILHSAFRIKTKAVPIFAVYAATTIFVTYLTWPYLWTSPIPHFMDSLQSMSKFPDTGETLFMGNMYPANQLPLRYVPTFIIFQLTEPALILAIIGGATFFVKGKNREPFWLFAIWFLAPTLYIIFSGSTLYDNARQLFFLFPPIFILAGLGLDFILERVKTFAWQAAIIVALIFPGVYACVQLHPYQYVYFNSFAGGVSGAFRQYDLDYWGTSFKEAFAYINENAPPNAQVIIVGPRQIARAYARPDLKVIGPKSRDLRGVDYYYVLYLTRSNEDVNRCPKGETVYSIERNGGILSYIKKATPDQRCW